MSVSRGPGVGCMQESGRGVIPDPGQEANGCPQAGVVLRKRKQSWTCLQRGRNCKEWVHATVGAQ